MFLALLSITTLAFHSGAIGGEIPTIAPTIDPQRKKRKKESDIR